MRTRLPWPALLVPLATGCIDAGTTIEYEPKTKAVRFHRPWLGGPVEFEGSAEFADGTKLKWSWKSDVDLDPAASVRAKEVEAMQKTVELAAELAKSAAGGP